MNAGSFAIRGGALHVDSRAGRYAAVLGRTGALVQRDRLAPNHAIPGGVLGRPDFSAAVSLDTGCNWICDRGAPMWSDDAGAFWKPYSPSEPSGALHSAGLAKRTVYNLRRTGGSRGHTQVVRGAAPDRQVLAWLLAGANLRIA